MCKFVFVLIVDECQDLSNHSQVAIVLKYATDKLVEVESFLGFFRTEKHDGQSLTELITGTLASLIPDGGVELKH